MAINLQQFGGRDSSPKPVALLSSSADADHINHGDVIVEHKFVAAKKLENANTAVQRRHKLARRIGQQMSYARQMVQGKQPR